MTYGIRTIRPRLWLEGMVDFRFLTSDMRTKRFYNDKVTPHNGKFSFEEGKVKFKASVHTCRDGTTGSFYTLVRAMRISGRLKKIKQKHKKYLNRKWRPSVVKICFNSSQGRKSCEQITKIADALLGNSFVLLFAKTDINPIGGKAGDFTYTHKKTNNNDYSYDVLSEACIFHPSLVSFATGVLRMALAIHFSGYGEEFLKHVNEKRVQRAINENNLRMARRVYQDIKPFLKKVVTGGYGGYDDYAPLSGCNLKIFDKILKKGGVKGTLGLDFQKNWGLRIRHGRNSRGWMDTERYGPRPKAKPRRRDSIRTVGNIEFESPEFKYYQNK